MGNFSRRARLKEKKTFAGPSIFEKITLTSKRYILEQMRNEMK